MHIAERIIRYSKNSEHSSLLKKKKKKNKNKTGGSHVLIYWTLFGAWAKIGVLFFSFAKVGPFEMTN